MRNSSYIENCKQLYSSLIAICEHLGITRDKSLLSVAKEKSSIQLARNKASYDEMLDNIVVIARRSNTHAGGRFFITEAFTYYHTYSGVTFTWRSNILCMIRSVSDVPFLTIQPVS